MESLIYLDNAATAWPKPDSVYEFMDSFYRSNGVNPGRSGFDMAIGAGDLVENTRARLRDFFHGDSAERVVFTYNATDSLNLLIRGVVQKGDHVISTNLEHNSVLRPLKHLEREGLCEVTWLPFNEKGFIDPEDVKQALKPNTRLVIVNHGSNVIGTIQDLTAIGKVTQEAGVLFGVDASQTAGVLPIDMHTMHIDLLVTTGHKAMMGPTGIGVLVVRDHVDVAITRAGGTGVRSAYPYHLEEYPWRLEAGTLNLVGVAGLWAGQEWIDKTGLDTIYTHEHDLAKVFTEAVREIEGVTLYVCDDLENHLSTISLNVAGFEAGNTGTLLDVEHNIATRTGLQCAPKVHEQIGTDTIHGTVRFSIGAFNTREHIDKAIEGVREIAEMGQKRL
ncbi:aminotransferase class V-fold PLP-dependent enzyme [bacterium]|nr:aminotransferase class V-fold PLP-dependent enzyme [bacterium]